MRFDTLGMNVNVSGRLASSRCSAVHGIGDNARIRNSNVITTAVNL